MHWTCEIGNWFTKEKKFFSQNARKTLHPVKPHVALLWINTATKSDVKKRRVKKRGREETEWMWWTFRWRVWPFSNCASCRSEVRGKCHMWMWMFCYNEWKRVWHMHKHTFSDKHSHSHTLACTHNESTFLQVLTCKCSHLQTHTHTRFPDHTQECVNYFRDVLHHRC